MKSSEAGSNFVRKPIVSSLQLLRCLKWATRYCAITVGYLTPIYNSSYLHRAVRKLRRSLRKSGRNKLI